MRNFVLLDEVIPTGLSHIIDNNKVIHDAEGAFNVLEAHLGTLSLVLPEKHKLKLRNALAVAVVAATKEAEE